MHALHHAFRYAPLTSRRLPNRSQPLCQASRPVKDGALVNTQCGPFLGVLPASLLTSLLVTGGVSATFADPAQALSLSDAAQVVTSFASDNTGPLGVTAFILAYVGSTVLLVPGSLLTLAAGAIYGPVLGTAVVSVASTLGATAAFVVARTAARPWVEDRVKGSPQVKAVLSGIGKEGARLVFLLRLSPLVPFTLLNYALGLTQVGLLEYTLASWIGMLPGTFAYVYLGGAGKAAVDAVADGSTGQDPTKIALWVVGAAATLLATKLASDAASRELSKVSAVEAGEVDSKEI